MHIRQPTPQSKPHQHNHEYHTLPPNMNSHRSAHCSLLTGTLCFASARTLLVADLEETEQDAADWEEDYDCEGHYDAVGDVGVCPQRGSAL